ncbi:hypothetical protein [Stieleria varia]|uniref:hypothetical protein n=1 Tax=Stieleria varia TaxID=2528005 RepID=UPI001E65D1D1|nr:hypothetical protein [Stieleria varia]
MLTAHLLHQRRTTCLLSLKYARKLLFRACQLLLVLAAVLFVTRNWVSRAVSQRVASSLLGTKVEIDRVFVGWNAIRVDGMQVFEPNDRTKVQIQVDRVAITTSILQGLLSGVWLDSVSITNPQLHLHFAADGKLLSQFPESSGNESGSPTIPIRSLKVSNASVIVHQDAEQKILIAGANLAAHFGHFAVVRAQITDLFSGTLAFQSRIDLTSFVGKSQLMINHCRFNRHLIPRGLMPSSEPWSSLSAGFSVNATVNHAGQQASFAKHPVQIRVTLDDVAAKDFGTVVEQLTLLASMDDQGLNLDVTVEMLDGQTKLKATTDAVVAPMTAQITSEVTNCNLTPLMRLLDLPIAIKALGDVTTRSSVNWDGSSIRFDHSIKARGHDIRVDELALTDASFQSDCRGQVDLSSQPLDLLTAVKGSIMGQVTLPDIDLRCLSQSLAIDDLSGTVGGDASFSASLNELLDWSTVQANATLRSTGIRGHGMKLSDSQITCVLDAGKIKVGFPEIVVSDSQGAMLASARGSLTTSSEEPIVHGSVDLKLTNLTNIATTFGMHADLWGGSLSNQISLRVASESIANPERWNVVSTFASHNLVVAGEPIDDVILVGHLNKGDVTVAPTTLRWRENVCTIALSGRLQQNLIGDAEFSAGPVSLADVADVCSTSLQMDVPLTGIGFLAGRFSGNAKERNFHSSGQAVAKDVIYAGTGIGSANLNWVADNTGLQIQSASNDFVGGKFSLLAMLRSFQWNQSTLECEFSGIQIPRLSRVFSNSLSATGTLDGGCSLALSGAIQDLSGSAWVISRGFLVERIPIENAGGKIKLAAGVLSVTSQANCMRGSVTGRLSGEWAELLRFANAPADLRRLPLFGEAEIKGLAINECISTLRLDPVLHPLSGLVHATCKRNEADVRDGTMCSATGSFENLRWDSARLSQMITAKVDLYPDRIKLTSIDGRFADGQLNGRAEVLLGNDPRGTFQFSANRVNLRQAAAPIQRSLGSVSGTASVRVSGRIGQTLAGRMDVSADNSTVASLNVRAVRMPFDWTITPSTKNLTWRCRSGVVEVGNGKINVATEGEYSRALDMRLTAKLSQIDTTRLIRGNTTGAGILNGQVNLWARRATRPEQIAGDFDLTMAQVDSLELPILDQLDQLVRLSPSLGATRDNTGVMRGRLSNGQLHVDRLAITQSNVQVLMDGAASLDGRLDFDITAATGTVGPADGLSFLTDSPLMLAAPAPVALVLKANEAMKDRVVHVHVGGTANKPTLRLQPAKQLTQDTLRFFLTAGFGADVANIAEQSRQNRQLR